MLSIIYLLYGNARIQAFANDKEELGEIRDGDVAGYKYIDFGSGIESLSIRVRPGTNPGKVELKLGNSWGPNIATLEIPGREDASWQTIMADVDEVKGVQALWLRFAVEGEDLLAIDWIRFN